MRPNTTIYNGKPVGSEWHKWDLHVHTPASVIQHYGDSNQDATWEKYITSLEQLPKEIKAIGINDYFFIEGYRRVRKAKDDGRLANLELILPVIELRIALLAGHKKLSKINYHVIFSDELEPDFIETFFLHGLGIELELSDGKQWEGRISSKEMLEELGQEVIESTPQSKRSGESPLRVGFNNAVFSLDQVRKFISETRFQGKILTAVGITEWDNMRFESAAGLKRDIINQADLVFVASPSIDSYFNRKKQLEKHEVNARLLDCSDAHYYADSPESTRLGNTFSWLKADLTFQGLRRVVQCFDDRVDVKAVGDMPKKLRRVQDNRTKYIQSIEIRKKPESTLEEKWFDCLIPLNPGLVAVIGNQGNGKSALTDIIALCGNTKTGEFSFLTKDKFRDTQNKAKEFIANLQWADGTDSSSKGLEEGINEEDVERVRYVPQGFFDAVTNETIVRKGGRFYTEIEKAVFSHIQESDRLGYASIDRLIGIKTDHINQTLVTLRQELRNLNIQIVELEVACSQNEVARIENEIKAKNREIVAHKSNIPQTVQEPPESSLTSQEIEKLREKERQLNEQISQINEHIKASKQSQELLKQTKEKIIEQQRQVSEFVSSLQRDLDNKKIELVASQMVSVQVNTSPIEEFLDRIDKEIRENEYSIDPDNENSLVSRLKKLTIKREAYEAELEQVNKAYQDYRNDLINWERHLKALIGNNDSVNSLEWLEQELKQVTETKPQKLRELLVLRQDKSKMIYDRLKQISAIYQELTQPAQAHIETEELTREKYKLRFAIDLVEQGLGEKLFSIIKRSGAHTFAGQPDGDERLSELVGKYNFESRENAVEFAEILLVHLVKDHRHDPPKPIKIGKILRGGKVGKKIQDIYDLIFGFEYLTPEYSITLNGKPLKQLSPGERGILLLVFYLVIDKGDIPLIIDQPEGNLNNQSIFNNLVPVFKKAKSERQIIVVTHNPNLAVVCDAEQIIHAEIDFEDGNRVQFNSGSLEHPLFTELSLDVLEGTPPAFQARKHTYELTS